MSLLNNDVLSVLTQYIDDVEAPELCDVMDYDQSNYTIKNPVDITTYKPSDGVISKVFWDISLNLIPHTFYVVCRLDDFFRSPEGSYHEVQIDRHAKVSNNVIKYENKNGKLHRIGGPAIEWISGDKWWYENGELHRIGGPAFEWANGNKEWYKNGKRHRIGGPAFEWANGNKEWYKNGRLHRIGGAAIEYTNGNKWWYENGKRLAID